MNSPNSPVVKATVKATDWFRITGRGLVAAVDFHALPKGLVINRGDHVKFTADSRGHDPELAGLIGPDRIYEVTGIEQAWTCMSPPSLNGVAFVVREIDPGGFGGYPNNKEKQA